MCGRNRFHYVGKADWAGSAAGRVLASDVKGGKKYNAVNAGKKKINYNKLIIFDAQWY